MTLHLSCPPATQTRERVPWQRDLGSRSRVAKQPTLRPESGPGWSGWAEEETRERRERAFLEASLPAVAGFEDGRRERSQRQGLLLEAGEGQETDCPLEPPEGVEAC